jgi:spermidine synthase
LNWYFVFFAISGFCSVLYELVWLRLAMAQFGVTTAMVSIVLSVFMAGLGLGSWLSGKLIDKPGHSRFRPALRVYAVIELLIGVSSLLVPQELLLGHVVLGHSGGFSSLAYYGMAGLWVAISLLPWCTFMGATVPVGMRAIAQTVPEGSSRSFSYLYMANVAGAIAGTVLPLLLIELIGFRGTLRIGLLGNILIAVSALVLSTKRLPVLTEVPTPAAPQLRAEGTGYGILPLLFLSGLSCMAMEVVWVRSYTPYFGTVVYSFASILGVYLIATFLGSVLYRRWSRRPRPMNPVLWTALGVCALLPLLGASPGFDASRLIRLLVGLPAFTGLLGFLTPMLVDLFAKGDPRRAGRAYAVNVVGCIVGPLLAGFGLLPFVSDRWALVILAAPWLIVGLSPLRPQAKLSFAWRAVSYALLALAAILIIIGKGYDESYTEGRLYRDQTATVIATGTGMTKELLVNGYGMTSLTPITKVMAHLPLAFLDRPPQNALVICFGMGTTFRSLHSWGIPVTAVELVPSVPRMFSYYHGDGEKVLASPLSRVVIDDGRRFLERTDQQFDVITIDPPPPLTASASSLLYSEEFYRAARRRLRPGGILQQWLPTSVDEDAVDVAAVTRSLRNSFPYVRAFGDEFGIHYLCSDQPVPARTAVELIERMPASAINDLAEWDLSDHANARDAAEDRLGDLVKGELATDQLIAGSPDTPSLTDDRPINEYYVIRKWRARRHVAEARREKLAGF